MSFPQNAFQSDLPEQIPWSVILEKLRHNDMSFGLHVDLLHMLRNIDKELENPDSDLELMQTHMLRLETHQKSLRSLLSAPIRALPPEILGTIFWMYVDEARGIHLYHDNFPQSVPANTLGAVCYHWRNVTLSIPFLWTTMDITLIPVCHTTFLDLLLARSCTQELRMPLDVTITCNTTSDWQVFDCPLLTTLVCQCYRWHRITFRTPHDILDAPVFSPIRANLNCLQFLSVAWESRENFEVDPLPHKAWNLFEYAPHLTEVEIFTPIYQFALPWSSITSVRSVIWAGNDSNPRRDLSLCCHAQSLFLQLSCGLDEPQNPGAYPDLHCKSLELDLAEYAWAVDLKGYSDCFQMLSCPRLEALTISNTCPSMSSSEFTFPLNPLHSFCFLQKEHLRSLSIKDIAFTESYALISILNGLPQLEHLSVQELSNTKGQEFVKRRQILNASVLQGLTAFRTFDKGFIPFLPRLKSLELGFTCPSYVTVTDLVRLIESRWLPLGAVDGVVCIGEVILHWDKAGNAVDLLRPLKNAGLEIALYNRVGGLRLL